MNNINGINGYHGPPAVGSSSATGAGSQAEVPLTGIGPREDQVEISQIAHFLDRVSSLPDVRTEKVEAVRQALENGSYDVDGRLSEALDQFLEENLDV